MNASPPTDLSLRWAPWWVLAFVALWPLPGPAETMLSLGAILALGALALRRFRGGIALLSHEAWALTTVLFLSYWLPELISSPDAINPKRALRESLLDLRYLPFLWLVAIAVAGEHGRRITFGGLGVIVAVWTLGGLVQAATDISPVYAAFDGIVRLAGGDGLCSGHDLADLDRLSGAFGPCNLKLGLVLASLSPFVLHGVAARFGAIGWYVAAGAVGMVVLMAGARAAWLTYALVLVFSGWRLLGWKRLGLTFVFGVVALVALGLGSPQVRERLERTTQAMSADVEGVDVALSGRTRIWSAAWCMVERHPINGVGVRGFRTAFPECDPNPEVEAEWGQGSAYHAHQIVLEVLSETGLIGLLLWLSGIAMAWRAWRFASAAARDRARPAMLALAVTVFPLNTHLAFYSSFWGGLTLLLAALYAGSLLASDADAGAAPAPCRD